MPLYLRSGGKLSQFRADAEGISRAFAALPPGGKAVLALLRGGDSLHAFRGADGRFRFRAAEQNEPDALGHRASARRDFDAVAARRLLELFAARDKAWRAEITWKRGVFDLPVAILATTTIVLCVLGYFAVAGASGGLKAWSWRYLPNLVVGLVLVTAVFVYADWFFRRLRKRIAAALGQLFGLRIVESETLGAFARPGMWESADGGVVSELEVTLLDILVMLLGLLIPVFALGAGIVLAARPILA